VNAIQRFRVDGLLGEGGMGVVYRAYDPELQRPVAIKLVAAPEARLESLDEHRTVDLHDPQPRSGDELLAEARVMAAISHPNVLPIFEIGRLGDKLFLVMELVDGVDLRRWLARAPHAVPDIIAVLIGGARGLAAAHARGIVHGDFKPDNLLIASDGRVLVGDFGVSSFVAGPRASMVRVDDARGTPAYMAPEIWHGERPSPAADVYAFAMTAAEALLGKRPSPPQTAAEADALDRELAARDVPANVRDTVVRGLDPEPRARPTEVVAGLTVTRGRRRWIAPAIAGGVVAAGAAIAIAVATRGGGPPSCPAVSRASVWSPARAAELAAASIPDAGVLAATLDTRFADEATVRTGACRRRAAGELGSVEHAAVAGCLDRVVIEYDERIKVSVASPARAAGLLGFSPPFADCATRRDPPPDPAVQRALVARFLAAIAAPEDDGRRELIALGPLAVAAGDHELAARITSAHATELAAQRDLPAARTALEQARAYAQKAGSLVTELRVVCDHIKIERTHDELAIAGLLANDAKVLVERAPRSWVTERALTEVATVASLRGDHREARDYNRRVLAIMEAEQRGTTIPALERRLEIVHSSPRVDEPAPDYQAFVEETHRLLDALYPDRKGRRYRTGLFTIVEGFRAIRDPRADALWEQGLELLRTEEPEPGISPIAQKGILAGQLFYREQQDEAIELMRDVVRESARASTADLAAANRRDDHLMILAMMLVSTNRPTEAQPVAADALLEITGKVGPSHARTRAAHDLLVTIALARGDVEAAEKHVEAIDRALRTSPNAKEAASLDVARAGIARLRGDLAAAEPLARRAVTKLAELGARPDDQWTAKRELGRILAAQHREAEAIPVLIDSLALAERRTPYDCLVEFEIARLERIAGKRADGDARAKRCLEMVQHISGFAAVREAVETWLAAP
jgi:hypothetical protein